MRKIFVAGHNGMVGSAICRLLKKDPKVKILTKSSAHLDLKCQKSVKEFFVLNQPDEVILAAAKVGGIYANNTYPAEFIYENLQIQNNIIHSSFEEKVKKLLFLGSSCIYPKLAKQPIEENYLLTGKLEPTNEPYAIAKIAGIKMCESYNRQYGCDFRAVMPTNLYGPGDNYHPTNSHVVPALIRRFHEAKVNRHKSVVVWGTGNPRREFLYVEDMASACLHILNMKHDNIAKFLDPMMSHINIGSGEDIQISELSKIISEVIGYNGEIIFDNSKPDGAPRKLLDIDLIKSLGWKPRVSLTEGISRSYKYFLRTIVGK